MEDGFGGALILNCRRLGGEDHEVEVAERRHFAPPSPAEPDQREPFAARLVNRALVDEIIGEADELVMKESCRLGCGPALARLIGEATRDLGAPFDQRLAKNLRNLGIERLSPPNRPV